MRLGQGLVRDDAMRGFGERFWSGGIGQSGMKHRNDECDEKSVNNVIVSRWRSEYPSNLDGRYHWYRDCDDCGCDCDGDCCGKWRNVFDHFDHFGHDCDHFDHFDHYYLDHYDMRKRSSTPPPLGYNSPSHCQCFHPDFVPWYDDVDHLSDVNEHSLFLQNQPWSQY